MSITTTNCLSLLFNDIALDFFRACACWVGRKFYFVLLLHVFAPAGASPVGLAVNFFKQLVIVFGVC